MTSIGDDDVLAVADRRRHAPGQRGELLVERSGDENRRTRHVDEPTPQRLLCPGAGRSKRRSETMRSVATTIVEIPGISRERAEQRLGEPLLEKLVETDVDDVVGEGLVSGTPFMAFGVRFDTGSRTDENESTYEVGSRGRHVKGGAATHRITDVQRGTHRVGQGSGVLTNGKTALGRPPVSRSVRSEEIEIAPEMSHDRLPRESGLRESVEENDRCSLSDSSMSGPRSIDDLPVDGFGFGHASLARAAARRRTRSKVSLSCAPGIAHWPLMTYVGTPVIP